MASNTPLESLTTGLDKGVDAVASLYTFLGVSDPTTLKNNRLPSDGVKPAPESK